MGSQCVSGDSDGEGQGAVWWERRLGEWSGAEWSGVEWVDEIWLFVFVVFYVDARATIGSNADPVRDGI